MFTNIEDIVVNKTGGKTRGHFEKIRLAYSMVRSKEDNHILGFVKPAMH